MLSVFALLVKVDANYLAVYVPIHLSAYLSICLCIYLSIYLSVYLYLRIHFYMYIRLHTFISVGENRLLQATRTDPASARFKGQRHT